MIEAATVKEENEVDLLHRYISRMPSLSTTVMKVLEICNSPRICANDLKRIISLDPVLTGKLLTVVNSAYYALPNKVTSLTRAIIMLGINTVVNLAMSTAILQTLGGKESFKALSIDGFWTHSLCVAVTAKALATIKGLPVTEREEYFIAGLLHDLGKIPLNRHFPDEYLQALDLVRIEQGPLHHAESLVLGINHCEVGKMIAHRWQLSRVINDSLWEHHSSASGEYKDNPYVAIVALANAYANIFEIGSSGDPFPDDPMVVNLLEQVGVSWRTLSELYETVLDDVERARVFLQVAKKG